VLRVALKNLAAKKLRLMMTSVAVVLGVAFMAGTFVLTDTLGNVFDALFTNATKGVDVVVRAREPYQAASQAGGAQTETRPPVPDALVDEIRRLPQVARAQGSLSDQYALVVGRDGKAVQHSKGAPTLALVWRSGKDAVNRSLTLTRGNAPSAAGEVVLDQQTFEDGGYKIGDPVTILFNAVPPREFTLTGVFQFGGEDAGPAGATLAAFIPSTAQEVTGFNGVWSEIEVASSRGVSPVQLRDSLRSELTRSDQAAQYQVITGEQLARERSDDIKTNLSFFNIFLLIFAIVALFVGSFIIYNTFSITVAQRTRELGLLRALGASGRQVVASVALEALVVGVFASTVGLGVGIAIVKPLEAVLSAFGVTLPSGPMQILPRTIIVSLGLGTLITFVSALAPARRAARVPPIAALRDQATSPSSGRRRYLWGGFVTVVGIGALLQGLLAGSGGDAAITVGVAAALVFIGVAMLSPLAAEPVAHFLTLPAQWRRRITGLLARENAARNPRRTASTSAALMIGLALVTLIAIFGASAKDSFGAAIDAQTRADFVISSESFQGFSPQVATAIRDRLDGGTVVEIRTGSVQLAGTAVNVSGVSGDVEQAFDVALRGNARIADYDTDGGVFVYQDEAKAKHLKIGDTISAVFPKGPRSLTVQGIFDNQKVVQSDYLVSLTDWSLFDTSTDMLAMVVKGPDATTAEARRTIDAVVEEFPGVKAEDKTQFKESQLAQLDQILGLMYVLLLLAVVIALIGIVNTLALSVFERTREIGLLRAVGMTRRQTSRMVRNEAFIVAVFGALLGLAVGIVFGAAIVAALANEGIALSVPVGQLVVFVVLAGIFGIFAGWWPARHAAHLDVLQAVNAE
jgi:putative ABC transport system permease protein